MINIQLKIAMNQADEFWAVYSLQDENNVVFIGNCNFTDVLKMPDVRGIPQFDPNKQYTLQVISVHHTAAEAKVAASKLTTQHNRPVLNQSAAMKRHCAVKCVETGKIYYNATECANQNGIKQSALSNHLNNKPGYRTVKGNTYVRVVPPKPDLTAPPSPPPALPWIAIAEPGCQKPTISQGYSKSKYVIARGEYKNVAAACHKWLLDNSTSDAASAWAADYGLY